MQYHSRSIEIFHMLAEVNQLAMIATHFDQEVKQLQWRIIIHAGPLFQPIDISDQGPYQLTLLIDESRISLVIKTDLIRLTSNC